MNYKVIGLFIARILSFEALFLTPALGISVFNKEYPAAKGFLISMGIILLLAGILYLICRGAPSAFRAKEGLACVGVSWIVLSLAGCLPFWLSREIPHFVDAFFEIVSGFTTTGASILTDVEAMEKGLLFWRSFTHWIGGMGVLVFLMVFLSGVSNRTIHIIRAEMPGPTVGKLVPKVKDTAKILYVIYLVMTFIQVICLLLSGMDLFHSLVHTFGSAGTGGFGVYADSAASLTHAQQWIIGIFMMIFGVNFNLYYFVLIKKFKSAIKNEELLTYAIIVLFSVVTITMNIRPLYEGISESLRYAAFQVAAVISTTGFAVLHSKLFVKVPSLSFFLFMS